MDRDRIYFVREFEAAHKKIRQTDRHSLDSVCLGVPPPGLPGAPGAAVPPGGPRPGDRNAPQRLLAATERLPCGPAALGMASREMAHWVNTKIIGPLVDLNLDLHLKIHL